MTAKDQSNDRHSNTLPSAAALRSPICIIALACLLAAPKASVAADYFLSENGDYLMVVAATRQEYGELYADIHQVYRVRWFNAEYFAPTGGLGGHGAADPETFVSAIFEINYDDVPVSHFFDMSVEGLEQHVSELQGHAEMIQVDAYFDGAATRYAYIAYHQQSPDWEVLAGMPAEVHELLVAQLPNSMREVNRSYSDLLSSSPKLTSLYKADNTDTIVYGALDWNGLTTIRNDLWDQGYRLTSMEIRNFPGLTPSYTPVFKRNGNYIFSTQSLATGFTSEIVSHNENEAAGDKPLFVALTDFTYAGGSYGAVPTFYAGWLGRPKLNRDVELYPGKPQLTNGLPSWEPFKEPTRLKTLGTQRMSIRR